jgi:hypothetical protein
VVHWEDVTQFLRRILPANVSAHRRYAPLLRPHDDRRRHRRHYHGDGGGGGVGEQAYRIGRPSAAEAGRGVESRADSLALAEEVPEHIRYDVIVVDLPDPRSPADARLLTREALEGYLRLLRGRESVLVAQATSPVRCVARSACVQCMRTI